LSRTKSSRVSRSQIPRDAQAARNLRRRINRFLKGKRSYNRRYPVYVHFQDGITDGFTISNLSGKDRDDLAKVVESWRYRDTEGFIWIASVCLYQITPMNEPLKIHPIVLMANLHIGARKIFCPVCKTSSGRRIWPARPSFSVAPNPLVFGKCPFCQGSLPRSGLNSRVWKHCNDQINSADRNRRTRDDVRSSSQKKVLATSR
jgi:hypothetical protein